MKNGFNEKNSVKLTLDYELKVKLQQLKLNKRYWAKMGKTMVIIGDLKRLILVKQENKWQGGVSSSPSSLSTYL
jgi:hypothetical protein